MEKGRSRLTVTAVANGHTNPGVRRSLASRLPYWDTYRANEHDKLRHGTWLVGEQINAKLTEAEVLEIRRLKLEGKTLAGLAAAYGVTPQNVAKIVRRESWRHLP